MEDTNKLVIVMIGLPARGKSYITKKLIKYFNWLQYNCKVFNVGNTRRLNKSSTITNTTANNDQHSSKFFDPANHGSAAKREEWAMDTLTQLIAWIIKPNNCVGIFDATNTTKQRRKKVVEKLRSKIPHLKILFLESICNDPLIIEKNIKLKLSGPDYIHYDDVNEALNDFKGRLLNYEKIYETIDHDDELLNIQYIKIIDVGLKIISFNIDGFLACQTVFYLLNFKLNDKQIWLTRHGETYNDILVAEHRLGNTDSNSIDSSNLNKLTPLGVKFSKTLTRFINFQKKNFRLNQFKKNFINNKASNKIDSVFEVWTSIYSRTIETSKFFNTTKNNNEYLIKNMKDLNDLSFGALENLTLEQFKNQYPNEFSSRLKNKLNFRFPGSNGESYYDVINRLKPIITDLERLQNNVLIISHKIVTRILLGYFMNFNKNLITDIKIPLHCIYCLVPKPYGVDLEMYQYDENLDWFYKVPENKILRKGSISNESLQKKKVVSNMMSALSDLVEDDPFMYSSSEEDEEDEYDNEDEEEVEDRGKDSERKSLSKIITTSENFEFRSDNTDESLYKFDDTLLKKLKNLSFH